MDVRDAVYDLYARRLMTQLAEVDQSELPRHVGVILDGNRRWASEQGTDSAGGHRAGRRRSRNSWAGVRRPTSRW